MRVQPSASKNDLEWAVYALQVSDAPMHDDNVREPLQRVAAYLQHEIDKREERLARKLKKEGKS